MVLHRVKPRDTTVARNGFGLCDLCSIDVRAADLAHLAFGNEFGQGTHRLGHRRSTVGSVVLVVIDVVGAESGETGVDCGADRRCRPGGWVVVRRRQHAPLGCDQYLIATATDRCAEILLGGAGSVALGRVEIVDAGIDRCIDDELRLGGVDTHPEVVAAEPDNRCVELADGAVAHIGESTAETSLRLRLPWSRCRFAGSAVGSRPRAGCR